MTLPFNPFRIDWNDCTFGQWEALLARCKRPTLLQTWQYGVAMAKVEGWKADFGIIQFEGKPVGMVLVQTRKWLPFLTACRIHRGPLWIYDEIPGEMLKLVLGMLRQRYQLRRGRLLMFHPELPDDPATRQRMSATGFWRWSEGYASVWLDLAPSPDALHAGLHGKWRNQLRQAERHNLVLETETSAGKRFDWLMEHYLEDKVARRYPGPPPAFLRAMHSASTDKSPLVVLRALHGGEPVAGVLLVRHGRAVTYQVGWTSERGRAVRALHRHPFPAYFDQPIVSQKPLALLFLELPSVRPIAKAAVGLFSEPDHQSWPRAHRSHVWSHPVEAADSSSRHFSL